MPRAHRPILGIVAALGLITGIAMTLATVATFVAADYYRVRPITFPPATVHLLGAQPR